MNTPSHLLYRLLYGTLIETARGETAPSKAYEWAGLMNMPRGTMTVLRDADAMQASVRTFPRMSGQRLLVVIEAASQALVATASTDVSTEVRLHRRGDHLSLLVVTKFRPEHQEPCTCYAWLIERPTFLETVASAFQSRSRE